MTVAELRKELKKLSHWRTGLVLEPFDWLVDFGPADALTGLSAYRLIDPDWQPARGEHGRNWQPVLAVGEKVLVGASPEMLTELLAAAGYFERPQQFQNLLLLQFHRFALDFYQGYEVREQNITYQDGTLTYTGQATSGSDHEPNSQPFTTTVRPNKPAQFTVT